MTRADSPGSPPATGALVAVGFDSVAIVDTEDEQVRCLGPGVIRALRIDADCVPAIALVATCSGDRSGDEEAWPLTPRYLG